MKDGSERKASLPVFRFYCYSGNPEDYVNNEN